MTRRVQHVRMAEAAANQFRGLEGEFVYDTTNKELIAHDGVTPGGFRQARKDLSNVQSASISNPGKMTAEHASIIASLQTGLTTANAEIAALKARADALEATMPNVLSDINRLDSIGKAIVLQTDATKTFNAEERMFIPFDAVQLNTSGQMFAFNASPSGIKLGADLVNKTIRFTSSIAFDTNGTPGSVIMRITFGIADHFPVVQITRHEVDHVARFGHTSTPWRMTEDRIDSVVGLEVQTSAGIVLDVHSGTWLAAEVMQ